MKDSELDQLLRASGPAIQAPADFRRDVWLRIEASEASGRKTAWYHWIRRLLSRLALPPVALATCAVTILAGAWLGMSSDLPQTNGKVAYVQSISPFAHSSR